MREILFRGKVPEDCRYENLRGLWVEGNLVHQTEHYGIPVDRYHILYTGEFDCDYYDNVIVIPETVGQFTGLMDRNGKKIFEGDVVKTKYGRLCTVVWFSSPVFAGWDLESIRTVKNIAYTKSPTQHDLLSGECLEVVGNIHDNPELFIE
jgi:uncharacterized phage protein (TIGR01671 family)